MYDKIISCRTLSYIMVYSSMNGPCYLRAIDLRRHYHSGPQTVRALDGVGLDIGRGDFLGIVGSSGSGKSTILNLLAGLDTPTSGSIELEGRSFAQMSRRELSAYSPR